MIERAGAPKFRKNFGLKSHTMIVWRAKKTTTGRASTGQMFNIHSAHMFVFTNNIVSLFRVFFFYFVMLINTCWREIWKEFEKQLFVHCKIKKKCYNRTKRKRKKVNTNKAFNIRLKMETVNICSLFAHYFTMELLLRSGGHRKKSEFHKHHLEWR